MTKQSLLLIDADQIYYQVTSAAEYEHTIKGDEFSDAWMFEGQVALLTNIKEASIALLHKVAVISEGYDRVIQCFTSTPNFRHDVLPTYKGGRLKKRKPLCYWAEVHQACADRAIETRKYSGLEADDVMSIIATHPRYTGEYDVSIYSQDKDMLQVPNVPIIKPDGKRIVMTLEEANHWRYMQAISGDRTDGYEGLKGYGPAKAEKYLDSVKGEPESVYVDAVVSLYMEAELSPKKAYQQIDCACILRHGEYDMKINKPIGAEERQGI